MKLKYLFALFPMLSWAQGNDDLQLPEVIPPSPTVANLMHFEEVPVDYYTGQPNITIPISNKALDQKIGVSLALRYNTMGVRVTERSGWVGTGWSLEAGGVISRTVRGVADDLRKQDQNINKSTGLFYLDQYWNFASYPADDLEKFEYAWNVLGTSEDVYDSEPDLFQFSMLGVSGRFILVKEGGLIKVKQLNRDQKIKIEVDIDYGNFTTDNYIINGFRITDTNGYNYWFGYSDDYIETSSTNSSTTAISRDPDNGASPQSTAGRNYKSAWHLRNITTGYNNVVSEDDLARFYYVNSEETYDIPTSVTRYTFFNEAIWSEELKNEYNLGQFRPSSVATSSSTTTQTKKLTQIKFRDGTSYKFVLSSQGEHPENNGAYLVRIDYVRQTGSGSSLSEEVIRNFGFEYSITNTDDSVEDNERLWLDWVNLGDGLYQRFSYNKKAGLPRNHGYADPWGYCNGDYRATLDSGYNYYNYDAVKRGLLTKITEPTGGTKEFYFESNTFSYEGGDYITDFSTNPSNSTTQNLNHEFNVNQSGSVTDSGVTIVITHKQNILVEKNLFFDSQADQTIFGVYFESTTTNQTRLIRVSELYKLIELPAGTYTCRVGLLTGEALSGSNVYLHGAINVSYMEGKSTLDSNYKHYLLGGGVRISSIVFTDPADTQEPEKRRVRYYYNTHEHDIFNPNSYIAQSSGAVDARVGSFVKEYTFTEKKYLFGTEESTLWNFFPYSVTYSVFTHEPNIQLSKGGYVGYSNVKVFDGVGFINSSGEINTPVGYTQYEYTTAKDWPIPDSVFEYPYKDAPDLDYKRGLLLRSSVYDKEHRLIEETINTQYDYIEEVVKADSPFCYPLSSCEWNQFYDTFDGYVNINPPPGLRPYCPLQQGDCFGDNYQNCISNGGGVQTLVTDITAGRAELKESIRREYFYQGTDTLTTETKTTYTYNTENYQLAEQVNHIFENGTERLYKTQYQYPVGGYDTGLFSTAENAVVGSTMVGRNMLNVPIVVNSYKDNTLLNRVIKKYSNTYAGGIPRVKEVEAVKGTYTPEDRILFHDYDEYGNILKASKPEGTPVHYIWGYNQTLPVAKIEGDVDLSDSTVASIMADITAASNYQTYSEASLATALNNLRNLTYLSKAMVTTLIHKPGVGVKSVTDPRGNTMTYEYDDLGRLIMVKDKDGNLVSENYYNYRTQFP